MSRLKLLARRFLDEDIRAMIKAGILNNDLTVARKDFVLTWLVSQYKEELGEVARLELEEKEEEEKAAKKKAAKK